MRESIYHIPILNLVFALILVLGVAAVYWRWSLAVRDILYATARMVAQLILIGFVLVFIFDVDQAWLVVAILTFMLLVASWIALRPVAEKRAAFYPKALVAIVTSGVSVLALVASLVLQLEPWYEPRYLIPLAGMIFAGAMNSVSLCAERFESETQKGANYEQARGIAYKTALIPILNSFFAVGLVQLPGMMTGQILAGVSPLIAVRYQIMVMCMLLGSCGISAAIYLRLIREANSPAK